MKQNKYASWRAGSAPGAPKGMPPAAVWERGGRFRACCFPRLGSPPCTPPSEAPPFKKGTRQGGEPIPPHADAARSAFVAASRGGHSTAAFPFINAALGLSAFRISAEDGRPGTRSGPRVPGTTPPLCQSPQPPREAGHAGRSTNSLLSARLPALGGRVGPSAGLLRRARPRPLQGVRAGRGLHP